MKTRIAILTAALAGLLLAQEGHPLVGSWHGTWGPPNGEQHDATFVLNWDGKTISGMINPGLDVIRIQNASLDAPTWTVHLEGDTKDASGKTVRVVVDGKIERVTNPRRRIVGTWTQGGVTSPLRMTRDD